MLIKSLLSALGLVWDKLPVQHRVPVSFVLVGSTFLYYLFSFLIFDFPNHAKRAYDARWYALAAPLVQERTNEMKDFNNRLDRLEDKIEHIGTDTGMMKDCLINKRCGGR